MLRRELSWQRATDAVDDYLDLPLTRHNHQALLGRILELGNNISSYDATYVALTEQLSAGLLTMDYKLARAVQLHTGISVLP